MAMTLEEELSKLAADVAAISPAPVRKAVVYLFVGMLCAILAAAFLTMVAGQACSRGWGCTPAYVLSEIANYLGIAGLLLFPPALVLFFLRAAGCSSKPDRRRERRASSSRMSRSHFPIPLSRRWSGQFFVLFIGATSTGTISFLLSMYGSPEISNLLGDPAFLCMFLCEALVYIRGAVALQRMNPKPSNMVAVAE